VVMLGVAPLIATVLGESGPGFPTNYAILFGTAGVLFIISILPGLFFHELPGGKAHEQLPALSKFLPDIFKLLRGDGPFRSFIITRMFTSLFAMAAPFYVGYATVDLGLSSAVAVPVLLAMQTAGSIVGALAYTWIGARSNLFYVRLALGCSILLPVCALLAGAVGPLPLYLGFLASGLAATNLEFGYLNWIVGYADADQRPIYVGLSNTIFAVVALITPFIAGTIVEGLGYRPLFAVALLMALSALFVAVRHLRDPEAPAPVQ
jgi:predicted MFS family arabinose efflux permease